MKSRLVEENMVLFMVDLKEVAGSLGAFSRQPLHIELGLLRSFEENS